jgi:hypothetical protein
MINQRLNGHWIQFAPWHRIAILPAGSKSGDLGGGGTPRRARHCTSDWEIKEIF